MNYLNSRKTIFNKVARQRIALSLFMLLGLCIRIYKLGSHNIWFDEFIAFWGRKLSLHILFKYADYPLYSLLLNGWTKYFGESEFALRFLSMFFGVFCIPLIYKLGKLLFDEKIALVSAFILSVSPLHVWYSQEARRYSLSAFLVLLTVYFFILAIRTKKFSYRWLGFIVLSILSLYANYFTLTLIFILGAIFLFKSYRHIAKYYLVSLICVLLALFIILPFLLEIVVSVQNNFWVPRPALEQIAITFENFNVGYNATMPVYILSSLIFYSLFILGLTRWREKREELSLLFILAAGPIIITFLISQWIPIYLDRQMFLFSPFYYIIVAVGFIKINSKFVKSGLFFFFAVLIAVCLYNYFNYHMPAPLSHHVGVHPKKSNKPVINYAKSVKDRVRDEDVVAISSLSSWSLEYYFKEYSSMKKGYFFFLESEFKKSEPYWYNFMKEVRFSRLEEKVPLHNLVNLDNKPSEIMQVRNIEEYDFKRIWLISSSWGRDGNLDAHAKAVREWMRQHYRLLEEKEFDGIILELYVSVD